MAEGLLRMTLRQVPRAMGQQAYTPIFEGARDGHEGSNGALPHGWLAAFGFGQVGFALAIPHLKAR